MNGTDPASKITPHSSAATRRPDNRGTRLTRALLVWRRPTLWSTAHLPYIWEALEERVALLEGEAKEQPFRVDPAVGLCDRFRSVLCGDYTHLLAVARDLYAMDVHEDRGVRHVGCWDATASYLWGLWAERVFQQSVRHTPPPYSEQAGDDRDAARLAALALARLVAETDPALHNVRPTAVAGAQAALPCLLVGGPLEDGAWDDFPDEVAFAVSRLGRRFPGAHAANKQLAPAGGEPPGGCPPAVAPCVGPSLVVAPGAEGAIKRLGTQDRNRLGAFKRLAEPIGLPEVPGREAGEAALLALRSEMPNFAAAVERVRHELALLRHVGADSLRLRPMLLVGPPGVGKSRFGRRLAAALGFHYGAFSLAGASDNRALEGTSAGWSTAAPSWPLAEIERLGTAGPLLLADEVDKVRTDGRNGDPLQTLLDWLEPATARAARDPVLGAPVDLSRVSWLLCANDAGRLPGPLLGRLSVVRVDEPPVEAFSAVLRGVLTDLADDFGARPAMLPALEEAEVDWLEAQWRRSRTPRTLRKLTERLLALAAERPPGADTPLN